MKKEQQPSLRRHICNSISSDPVSVSDTLHTRPYHQYDHEQRGTVASPRPTASDANTSNSCSSNSISSSSSGGDGSNSSDSVGTSNRKRAPPSGCCRASSRVSGPRSTGRFVALLGFAVFLVLGLDIRILSPAAAERPRYRTTYACEGSTLNMDCEAGHVINLIRANYGRFSITICNEHGNTEWSVNCMSRRSHRVLHDKCTQRQNCSMAATTRGFGDPCPGTLKYLEAQFQCVPVNLPHGRPRPIWLVDAQSTVSSITGDQPLKRPPPHMRGPKRPDDQAPMEPGLDGSRGSAASSLDVAGGGGGGISGLPDAGLHGVDDAVAAAGGGAAAVDILDSDIVGSTSTTTTLRPPPWLKTNVTKNTTTTTTTSSTTSTTTTTTPHPSTSSAISRGGSSAPSSSYNQTPSSGNPSYKGQDLPSILDQEELEEERTLDQDEFAEREDLFKEQDRLLEKELGHGFSSQHYPSAPVGAGRPEDSAVPGWRPRESWCGPSSGRGLLWNWTRAGDMAIQACPGGASGWARRACLRGGWAHRADLGECRSVWLSTLTARALGSDSVLAVVHDLSAVTAVRALFGGDVTAAARLLSSLAKRMETSLYHFPDTAQREALLTELLSATLSSASHLIGSQEDAWGDLRPPEHRAAATALLLGLEQAAFLLADNLRHQKIVGHSHPNILMRLQVMETRNVAPVTFPSPDEVWRPATPPQQPGSGGQSPSSISSMEPAASSIIFHQSPSSSSSSPHHHLSTPTSLASSTPTPHPPAYDSITLPPEALLENSENGLVKMVFFSYQGLEKLLQPSEAVYVTDDPAYKRPNRTRQLNSRVLAASLGSGRHIELSEPVLITFALLTTANVTNASCVFWDYTTSSWSEEGCHVIAFNTSHVSCQCEHLTNFAVLMDFHATPMAAEHSTALSVITYVGCIVSIVCLVLAIVVFQVFKGLQNDRTSIHKNLCGCLLIAEIVFLAGVNRTANPVWCGVVAGLLHYFFLAAFAWMFMEGLQLYLMLVEVFEAERSRLKWYCAVAYGAPALVVLVSAAVDPLSYGTPQVCWLRADNYFIFAFVGPVAAVLLANAVFLVLSLIVLCRHASSSASLKNKEHTKLASVRTWLRGAFVLMFLLGLTWTFGLLYLNQQTIVMAYIFTILNSLQGLFIFVFHCVQNDKKYSFKSCGRDSGHGGSEQEDSPRTGTAGKLTSLRLNNNVAPRQPADRLVNPFTQHQELPSPEALLPDYRLAGENLRLPQHPRLRNQSPYNHTYTEISEGGKSISSRMQPDPVYEEIEREGRMAAELQVSDLSDEDGRRLSSDVSRQSSRSYGDHRPLLPYTLPDHLHASLQHLPHHHLHHLQQQLQQHQLHQNHVQQVHMQQQHQLQQQQIQQQLQQNQFHQIQQHQDQQQQQQHHHHHHHQQQQVASSPQQQMLPPDHPMHNQYQSEHPRPEMLSLPGDCVVSPSSGGNGGVVVMSPRDTPLDGGSIMSSVMPLDGSAVQPLSEPNLRSWEAVQHRRDMAQLQHHLGEMTVAVLNGEQVVCKLKSPLAPIQETTQQQQQHASSEQLHHEQHLQQQPNEISQAEHQQQQHQQQQQQQQHHNQQPQHHKHPVTSLTYSHC